MGQHGKLTKLRCYWVPIQIIVSKVKLMEMVEEEEGAVSGHRANIAVATKIKANHSTCLCHT